MSDQDNDIQVIIDCTQEDDVVLFSVGETIQPSRPIEIPWPLILSASTLNTELVSGVFPVTGVKATFTCPSDSEGIFLIQSRGVILANLAFEDCQLDNDVNIIEVSSCDDDDEITGAIQLHHLEFEDNELEEGVAVLMQSPSCSSLEMIDVEFQNTVCGGDYCCAVLSTENTLRNIRLDDNEAATAEKIPILIYAPDDAVTVIDDLEATDNEATVIEVEDGRLEIKDSVFEDNDAGNENGDACLKLDDATATITNCRFSRNRASVGAAVYLTDSTANITRTDFQRNTATWAGAVFLRQGSRVTITDGAFTENECTRNGGGLYSIASTLFLDGVNFANNTAEGNGGGLQVTSSPEAQMNRCIFIQNDAGSGGAVTIDTQSNGNFTNCIFSNNTGVDDAGGIFVSLSNVSISGGSFIGNTARRGGAVVSSNSSMAMDNTRTEANVAEWGGALHIGNDGNASIFNVSVISNQVTKFGGGVFIYGAANVTVDGMYFFNNSAPDSGGAVYAWQNSTVDITSSTFFSNSAEFGGAVGVGSDGVIQVLDCNFLNNGVKTSGGVSYIGNGTATIERCNFVNNDARFGGSVFTYNSTVDIRDSVFRNSSSTTAGGAIFSRENSTLLVENVTLLENHAGNRGGAISLNVSTVFITDSNFTMNTVDNSGAGIYGQFVEAVVVRNCTFIRNAASYGGALLFENQTAGLVTDCTFDHNSAEVTGGCVYVEDSNLTFSNAPLVNHSAQYGGDFFSFNSRLNVTNITSKDARSSVKGGSVYAQDQSLLVFRNVSIFDSRSPVGGGISLEPASFFGHMVTLKGCQASSNGGGIFANSSSLICSDCRIENNTAKEGGGGAFLQSFGGQQLAYQFDDVIFSGNSADSGGAYPSNKFFTCGVYFVGGIHFDSIAPNVSCLDINPDCTYLALVNTSFIDNYAAYAGGAILATDPETVRLRCPSLSKDNPIAYYSHDDITFFGVLQGDNNTCAIWSNNTANSYGATMGSFGTHVRMMIQNGTTNNFNEIIGNRYILTDHQSGRPIPSISMEVLDAFGHGPVVDSRRSPIRATMMSPDRFFCCPVEVELSNGMAIFKDVTGFRPAGVYRVHIDFSDDRLSGLLLLIVIRGCSIGQVVAANGTFCQECSDSTYNFLPEQEDPGCVPCPDDAACDNRAIRPNNGHWHQTPCSNHIQECLTDRACDQPGRDAILKAYGDDLSDCEFGVDYIGRYMTDQCRKGYDGPLCGSCAADYGRSRSFRCEPCFNGFSNFLLILTSTLVLLGLSGFTIRSNLATLRGDVNPPQNNSRRRLPREERLPIREPEVNLEMHEVPAAEQNQMPQPQLPQPPQERAMPDPPDPEHPTPMEMSKWRAVEIFKITVNYVQVIAVAISLNVDWTDALVAMFETAEFVGGVTSEAATRSVDCLIAEGSSVPRSAVRSAVGLLVPAVVYGFCAVFWGVAMVRFAENYIYLGKRCLLSFTAVAYLSYITITKTVVNVHYCVEVYDAFDFQSDRTTRYWAVDTSLKCYEGSHTVLAVLIGWPVMMLFSLGFPVAVAYILIRERKREQRSPWLFETAGFLYRAYDRRFIYWESVIMLRKALLAVVVVFSYPLGGNLQGVLSVFVLIIALYFQIVCHPFRHGFEELNEMEGLSLLVSSLTFVAGLFFNDERAGDFVRGLLSFFVFICNLGLFMFLVLCFLQVGAIYLRHILTAERIPYDTERGTCHVLAVYLRSRLAHICMRLCRCCIPNHRRVPEGDNAY